MVQLGSVSKRAAASLRKAATSCATVIPAAISALLTLPFNIQMIFPVASSGALPKQHRFKPTSFRQSAATTAICTR